MLHIFKNIAGKFSVVIAGVLIVSMGIYVVYFDITLKKHLTEGVKKEIKHNLESTMHTIEIFDKDNLKSAQTLFKVLQSQFETFNLIESLRSPVKGIDAPSITSGSEILNGNFSIVDRFTEMTGATATVFVKVGDDFLRASTSLKKENGERAVGTFLGKKKPRLCQDHGRTSLCRHR